MRPPSSHMHARRYIHFFKKFSFDFIGKNMTDVKKYKMLEEKALEAENLVTELRTELATLRTVVNAVKTGGSINKTPSYDALMQENEALKKEIEIFKSQLKLSSGLVTTEATPLKESVMKPIVPTTEANATDTKKEKPVKEKKSAAPTKASSDQSPVDVGRLDLRVGKIIDVKKHPDADSLYIEQIDVGEAKPRTVISGLVKFVPIEEMQGRMVVLLCNLKPAKMRGILSEAMVMCASTPEKVEILSPPAGSVPGDLVEVEGFSRLPDAVLNPKHKIFETVAPDLKTSSDRVATYKDVPWTVPGKGTVTAPTLTGVNIK